MPVSMIVPRPGWELHVSDRDSLLSGTGFLADSRLVSPSGHVTDLADFYSSVLINSGILAVRDSSVCDRITQKAFEDKLFSDGLFNDILNGVWVRETEPDIWAEVWEETDSFVYEYDKSAVRVALATTPSITGDASFFTDFEVAGEFFYDQFSTDGGETLTQWKNGRSTVYTVSLPVGHNVHDPKVHIPTCLACTSSPASCDLSAENGHQRWVAEQVLSRILPVCSLTDERLGRLTDVLMEAAGRAEDPAKFVTDVLVNLQDEAQDSLIWDYAPGVFDQFVSMIPKELRREFDFLHGITS